MSLKSVFATKFACAYLVKTHAAKLWNSGVVIYFSWLTTSFFTTSLSLLKSTVTGINLSISNLSSLTFKLNQVLQVV